MDPSHPRDDLAVDLVVVDPAWCLVPGWNAVWNRALPWFGTRTENERCPKSDYRVTAVVDDVVVGIAQVSVVGDAAQLMVAVEPNHRGRGIGGVLADEVALRASGAAFVFEHDPADPAAQRLADRHGLEPGAPMLALWSLDPRSVPPAVETFDAVGPWTDARPGDLDALSDAVRWWATDNHLDEARIVDWQRSLSKTADPWTTVARDNTGQVVGVAWAEPVPYTTYVRATHLTVKPDHRGRALGLALKTAQARNAAAVGKELLVTQIAPENRANRIWASLHAIRSDLLGFSRPG